MPGYTIEQQSLGETDLEVRTIKLTEGANPVKDRHYPISPAVQEIVYAEIDKITE